MTVRSVPLSLLLAFAVPTLCAAQPRAAQARTARPAAVAATPVRTFSTPFDAAQRTLAREATTERGARGILPLLELWNAWDQVDPAVTLELLQGIVDNRRVPQERRDYARSLLARAEIRRGHLEQAVEITRDLGYVTDWQVIGPFDNEGKQGFEREDGPEEHRMAAFDTDVRYQGKEREVQWRPYPDITRVGYVDFDALFRPYANVCGYAQTTIVSERSQALALSLGGGGAISVWWNGEKVHSDNVYREPDPDRSRALVGAHAGVNRLLVKTCVTESTWGFYLRVTDPNGRAPRGVTHVGATIAEAAGAGHGARLPRARPTIFETLQSAADAERASGRDLYDLARYLQWSGSDDPAEFPARQLAARAAEADPQLDHLLFASRLQEQRGDRMRFAAQALERYPNAPEAHLLHAQLVAAGLHGEDALPVLDRIEPIAQSGTMGMQAAVLRARILQEMDLPQAARRVVEDAGRHAPNAAGWLRLRAEYLAAANNPDAAVELRTRAVAQQWNDRASRRVLVADGVRRRDMPAVVAQLEAIRQNAPAVLPNLTYVAAIYEAIGRTGDAIEVFAQARRLAPEEAGTLVAHAQLLLRMQQSDAAIQALRAALVLRPQDAGTRELLEQIEPQERRDEALAADGDALLARRGEAGGFPLTTLQDLTVNTVYDNGLGSSFRQIAVQVHDDEGARQMRTYSMQFDPTSQRIDVRLARVYRRDGTRLEATQYFEQQLGEPWYRIYYDTRALVVVFPDLQPGDVVELRWRIDDVAHRNLFADYYGDLTFLQSMQPVKHEEYVLITPASREFFFNEPQLEGLQHTATVDGDNRIYRYWADDVPAIRSEPGMPGFTEIAPYLHVSTYGTWEDVGRWYWGLIQDQLQTDESLRRTVDELVAGKTNLRDKVVAIHDWVVQNTRYVGLEFGIHGYKPYRVTQIVRRGFGDCKDKASLLYAMFTHAGINAHIILTRTRRNGQIRDLPASLAVFDHAIAYVPELDLYIDGTAEHSGITELPDMDQGVTVLHVWPTGSELRRTPVLPPAQNQRERNLDVRLARDGSATLRGNDTVTGGQAPAYRSQYQAEGTRQERLERSLRHLFPGLSLQSQRFTGLDTLEGNVRYEYTAEAPQLAQRDGEQLRAPTSVLGDLTSSFARTQTRRYPLDLGSPSSYIEERVIHMPNGMRASQSPEGGEAESPFGRLRVTVEATARQVQTRTELEIRRDRVTPEEYPAFRAWVQAADRILQQRLILEGGR